MIRMNFDPSSLSTNDLFVGQFQFFYMALKKAGRSFQQGRALGDQIQHKFDTKRWRAMDAYSKQLETEMHVSKSITKPMSWLGKAVYNSYRALGAGDTFIPMIITLLALWAVRLPTSWFLSEEIGSIGIWWGIPIAWFFGAILSYIYYLSGRWKKKAVVKHDNNPD